MRADLPVRHDGAGDADASRELILGQAKVAAHAPDAVTDAIA